MTAAEHLRRLRRLVERLRRRLPPALPVRVRLTDAVGEKYFGDCCLAGSGRRKFFQIRLSTASDFWEHRYALVHEWAHALAWTGHSSAFDDHGPHWGVAYSKCYQQVYRVR